MTAPRRADAAERVHDVAKRIKASRYTKTWPPPTHLVRLRQFIEDANTLADAALRAAAKTTNEERLIVAALKLVDEWQTGESHSAEKFERAAKVVEKERGKK